MKKIPAIVLSFSILNITMAPAYAQRVVLVPKGGMAPISGRVLTPSLRLGNSPVRLTPPLNMGKSLIQARIPTVTTLPVETAAILPAGTALPAVELAQPGLTGQAQEDLTAVIPLTTDEASQDAGPGLAARLSQAVSSRLSPGKLFDFSRSRAGMDEAPAMVLGADTAVAGRWTPAGRGISYSHGIPVEQRSLLVGALVSNQAQWEALMASADLNIPTMRLVIRTATVKTSGRPNVVKSVEYVGLVHAGRQARAVTIRVGMGATRDAEFSFNDSDTTDAAGRFLVTYRGIRPLQSKEFSVMRRALEKAGVSVLDHWANTFLVEGDIKAVKGVITPGRKAWTVSPEKIYNTGDERWTPAGQGISYSRGIPVEQRSPLVGALHSNQAQWEALMAEANFNIPAMSLVVKSALVKTSGRPNVIKTIEYAGEVRVGRQARAVIIKVDMGAIRNVEFSFSNSISRLSSQSGSVAGGSLLALMALAAVAAVIGIPMGLHLSLGTLAGLFLGGALLTALIFVLDNYWAVLDWRGHLFNLAAVATIFAAVSGLAGLIAQGAKALL